MAYSHTSLSIESNLDIVGKYKELVDVTSNNYKRSHKWQVQQ